jgi:hypothetical protein
MNLKYLALTISLLLTACGESEQERQQKIINQQQQQLREQQQMFQQIPQAQVQPQVIQQPTAPVVVQSAPQHDNTLMNMATGALIGHALTSGLSGNTNHSNNDTHIIERKTVIINNPAPVQSNAVPVQPVVAPVQPKPSSMDMNKLSGASSFSTRPPTTIRPSSSMNMAKLSSKR